MNVNYKNTMQVNTFQRSALNNETFIIDIIRAFHPDFNIGKSEFNIRPQYQWVVIYAKGIEIGISFEPKFHGDYHKLPAFEKVVKNDNFECWRFTDDSKKDLFMPNRDYLDSIFKQHKIEKPTAMELYKYYYQD